jgi:hypothetical protein
MADACVIIYPMNALADSQLEELEKFIGGSGLEKELHPTYRRYTGQESDAERQAIAAAKPDILLTNFMMLELLMTRQDELDRAVIANAVGLDFSASRRPLISPQHEAILGSPRILFRRPRAGPRSALD